MKTYLPFALALMLCVNPFELSSQCQVDSLTTQAEIDSFPLNYPNCTQVLGDLIIAGEGIHSLDSLYTIQVIDSSFIVYGYDTLMTLTNLSGLEQLTSVGKDFKFYGNVYLDSIHLPNLKTVSGLMGLSANDSLSFLAFNDSLNYIGSLAISSNRSLESLEAFQHIDSLGQLDISFSVFSNVDDLIGLMKINGSLSIYGNYQLENLDGFANLEEVHDYLWIGWYWPGWTFGFGNDSLTSIDGLANLDLSSVTSIEIFGNYNLSYCHLENICNYLDESVTNNSLYETIYSNALGCESVSVVIEQCNPVGIIDVSKNPILIYPNPTSYTITISSENNTIQNIVIYNYLGQKMPVNGNNTIDVSAFPKGIYVVEVESDNGIYRERVVVE